MTLWISSTMKSLFWEDKLGASDVTRPDRGVLSQPLVLSDSDMLLSRLEPEIAARYRYIWRGLRTKLVHFTVLIIAAVGGQWSPCA